MSTIRRRTGGPERRQDATTQRKRGRQAIRENQAWEAKSKEPLREGSPGRMATRLADREASGEIVRQPEETDLSTEDLNEMESVDSDVKLEDEDLTPVADLDRADQSGAMSALTPGQSFFSEASDDPDVFELRVANDGRCCFQRPPWIKGHAATQPAEEDFDEAAIRFSMFDALAAWLENKRPAFLKNPQPLALGVNALDEIKLGLSSVVPGAFLELSKIGPIIMAAGEKTKKAKSVESYFSRYSSATSLVWIDGRLSLDFLFSHEARVAWVACAVKQFFEWELQEPLDAVRIAELREISIPKVSEDRDALRAMSMTSLTAPEFVARANQMAGKISWGEVLETHFGEHTIKHHGRNKR